MGSTTMSEPGFILDDELVDVKAMVSWARVCTSSDQDEETNQAKDVLGAAIVVCFCSKVLGVAGVSHARSFRLAWFSNIGGSFF